MIFLTLRLVRPVTTWETSSHNSTTVHWNLTVTVTLGTVPK